MRALTAGERVEVLVRLAGLGVHVDSKPVEGFVAKHPIRSLAPRSFGAGEIDIVKLYLRDIGHETLLAPEDENPTSPTNQGGRRSTSNAARLWRSDFC